MRGRRFIPVLLFLGLAAPVLWVGAGALGLALRPPSPSLPVPVAGVRVRQVADTFGAPRSGGRRHEGVDIFAPRHTPVRCPTEGMVLWVGEDRLGGRTVRVLGPGGRWHYFAHLETYGPVHPGERIPAGHPIGTVGDSGNARGTPPHLHYGIYRFGGGAIDPLPLLRAGSG